MVVSATLAPRAREEETEGTEERALLALIYPFILLSFSGS
jgi:hypothetical protein